MLAQWTQVEQSVAAWVHISNAGPFRRYHCAGHCAGMCQIVPGPRVVPAIRRPK
jgi:hypothetical protein